MLPHMRQITFYQTTRRRPLGWGSAYQTLRRPRFFFTRLRSGRGPPGRGEGFESWAPPGGKRASATIHPLTTRLQVGGERQPCCLFRFVLLQRIERERAMEVLLQDCTGPGARILPNCTATFFSLSLTPMTTTTTAAAAAFLILSSLTYYTRTSTAT